MNLSFECYAISDRGLRRRCNEDAYICNPEIGLFLVADGMGGENNGDVASQITAETFERIITPFITDKDATYPFEHSGEDHIFLSALMHCIHQTNEAVLKYVEEYPSHCGMGSTLTAVVFHEEFIYIAHVGDSRLYQFKDGQLDQITRDHTRVQEMVDKNNLTPEEARVHPQRHIITRCVGRKKQFKPDIQQIEGTPGIVYLLCSDGLYDMVSDEEIAETVMHAEELESAGKQLVNLANEKGGRDNITVVLFRQSNAGDTLQP